MVSRAEVTTFGRVQLRFTEATKKPLLLQVLGRRHLVQAATALAQGTAAIPGYATIPQRSETQASMDPTEKKAL